MKHTATRGNFVFRSLNRKIQFLFAGIFIIAVTGLQLGMFINLYKGMKDKYTQELDQTTALIAEVVRTYVDSSVRNYLIGRAESVRGMVGQYHARYLAGELTEAEALRQASDLILDPVGGKVGDSGYLAGVSGTGVLVIHPRTPGADASGHEFMRRAMAMKDGYIEYDWQNTGETEPRAKAGGMSYFAPWDLIIWASSYKSEFLNLVDLSMLEASLKDIRIGRRGYVFVMDNSGTLLIHPSLQGQNIIDDMDDQGTFYAREMLQRKDGLISYSLQGEGKGESGMTRFVHFKDLDLIIAAKVYYEDIYGLIRGAQLFGMVSALLALVLANILVFLLVSRIMQPISLMRKVADAVAAGDLSSRVPVMSFDEIGSMSENFNDLVAAMESLVRQLKTTSADILQSVQDLSVSSQEITTTSNQQAAAVKEIVSTMEDSDQLSKSIAVRIREVSTIAKSTKDVVELGDRKVKLILGKMQEIRSSNAGTIGGIKNLGDKIGSIWEIVNIINGIADQTKIIAFNAELEAAAAGSAGKNFQIVAAEIRRLADSTVVSTSEIKNKINEIQHSSDHLIIASEEGTARIQEGGSISEELRAMFDDIRSSSEISASSAEKIALSISQQVMAFEQILLTLKQISEGIDNFVTTTKST
ncbi:MAG: methyl-accepting chemotaxis protein, partial [Spirochaetota bacterium]